MTKKTVRYNLVAVKGARCYVEANTSEEAERIFVKQVLHSERSDWQVDSVKDTTPMIEKMLSGMNKQ